MDLDQQAEQAQQKQGLPVSMSVLGQGQGQGALQSQPDAYSQGTRGYQSNPVTAGVAYTSPTPSNSVPGGRGGLVTYPLPASGSATNSSIPSATFASSGGGRGGHTGGQGQGQGQGSRSSYSTQAQSQTAAADYSYGQQSQGHYSSYTGGTMQTQLQYVGQQTNPYSASQSQSQSQGQGQGQGQYTPQQQPYY